MDIHYIIQTRCLDKDWMTTLEIHVESASSKQQESVYIFSPRERRGAVMVLPEGTTCHDISTTGTRAFDYIKDNAVRSWPFISIFAQSRRYPTANGSPYVITGVDKTSAYANLAFPNRPPSVEIFATYQNEVLDPMERMSTAAREATADETLSPTPTIYVFSCEAYELRSAEPNGLKMSIKGAEAHLYTEIFVDRPPSRLRLPFLITVIQFDKDEQALSLNDKSFFSVHSLDIAAVFINTMQLRLWSTIPFGLFYLKRCLTEVQRDALMFTCSKSCSSDYFCSMFNDVFDLYKVVNSQGVSRLARDSRERVTEDPWHIRLWFWLSGRERVRGGTLFKELFRQGQFHFNTNDDLRSRSML